MRKPLALPMTGKSAVFNLRRSFANRDGNSRALEGAAGAVQHSMQVAAFKQDPNLSLEKCVNEFPFEWALQRAALAERIDAG